jgi:hypothetical protein
MTGIEIHAVSAPQGARLDGEDTASAALGLANWLYDWLYLAATPTFAAMALLTALNGSPLDGLCLTGPGATLSGMLPMYLFMSAFHARPWLKLIVGRRDAVGRS